MPKASQPNLLTRLKLPRQGSNLDSSDPESDVLPVAPSVRWTPRSSIVCGPSAVLFLHPRQLLPQPSLCPDLVLGRRETGMTEHRELVIPE